MIPGISSFVVLKENLVGELVKLQRKAMCSLKKENANETLELPLHFGDQARGNMSEERLACRFQWLFDRSNRFGEEDYKNTKF
jgi:hypothetical protein